MTTVAWQHPSDRYHGNLISSFSTVCIVSHQSWEMSLSSVKSVSWKVSSLSRLVPPLISSHPTNGHSLPNLISRVSPRDRRVWRWRWIIPDPLSITCIAKILMMRKFPDIWYHASLTCVHVHMFWYSYYFYVHVFLFVQILSQEGKVLIVDLFMPSNTGGLSVARQLVLQGKASRERKKKQQHQIIINGGFDHILYMYSLL